MAYRVEKAPQVLAFLRDYIATAPGETSTDAIFQFARRCGSSPRSTTAGR